jgi:hypothetical protein
MAISTENDGQASTNCLAQQSEANKGEELGEVGDQQAVSQPFARNVQLRNQYAGRDTDQRLRPNQNPSIIMTICIIS